MRSRTYFAKLRHTALVAVLLPPTTPNANTRRREASAATIILKTIIELNRNVSVAPFLGAPNLHQNGGQFTYVLTNA